MGFIGFRQEKHGVTPLQRYNFPGFQTAFPASVTTSFGARKYGLTANNFSSNQKIKIFDKRIVEVLKFLQAEKCRFSPSR